MSEYVCMTPCQFNGRMWANGDRAVFPDDAEVPRHFRSISGLKVAVFVAPRTTTGAVLGETLSKRGHLVEFMDANFFRAMPRGFNAAVIDMNGANAQQISLAAQTAGMGTVGILNEEIQHDRAHQLALDVGYALTLDAARRAVKVRSVEVRQGDDQRLFINEVGVGAWKGRRVFIIGGGPSVRQCNLACLKGEIVIGVNRAFELDPCGMAFSMDNVFHARLLEGAVSESPEESARALERWKAFTGFKLLTRPHDEIALHQDDIYVVQRDRHSEKTPPTLKDIGASNNSGHAAMLFAWAMGASEIHLIGFDMRETGLQQWWHAPHWRRHETAKIYPGFIEQFNRVAPALRAEGIRVINWSKDSAITCFEKRSGRGLEKYVTRSKPERPTVITFETSEEYAEQCRAMRRTARAFGLDVQIVHRETAGSWHRNCMQKPFVIREALKTSSGPLLFLDADSRMRRYPDVFDSAEFDFAYCEFDWDVARKAGNRTGLEVSSAVTFWRNTPATMRLLDEWCGLAEHAEDVHGARNDQQLLAVAIHRVPELARRTHKLRMTYNAIFDLGITNVVIEQMQASRMLKKSNADPSN